MGQKQDGTGQAERAGERISTEQLQALDTDGQRSVLFYLTGFLENSAEFQDALTRAYGAEMQMRARMAAQP